MNENETEAEIALILLNQCWINGRSDGIDVGQFCFILSQKKRLVRAKRSSAHSVACCVA
jgi:hypothetical protein